MLLALIDIETLRSKPAGSKLSQLEVVIDETLLTWPGKPSPRADRAALRGL
jgi:hypothetical protein